MGAAREILPSLDEWSNEIPYQIKKMPISEAYTALISNFKKGGKFTLKFKSRKEPVQSCYIPKTAFTKGGIYSRTSGVVRFSEALPDNFKDSRLVLDKDRWFVSVPYSVTIKTSDNQGRLVALDPGIRTFLTGFAENLAFKIGEGDFARIARLGHHLDKLLSKSKTQNIKKAINRMRHKIRNLVDELHYKTVRFLVDNFDVIILPTFETSKMSIKSNRRLRAKSVRSMMTFAFYRFSQHLERTAKNMGKLVVRMSEAYTSKTASWTGEIVNIGSSKTITSNGITLDRDINGARGIFLRALGDGPLAPKELCIAS